MAAAIGQELRKSIIQKLKRDEETAKSKESEENTKIVDENVTKMDEGVRSEE